MVNNMIPEISMLISPFVYPIHFSVAHTFLLRLTIIQAYKRERIRLTVKNINIKYALNPVPPELIVVWMKKLVRNINAV